MYSKAKAKVFLTLSIIFHLFCLCISYFIFFVLTFYIYGVQTMWQKSFQQWIKNVENEKVNSKMG